MDDIIALFFMVINPDNIIISKFEMLTMWTRDQFGNVG